MSWNAPADTDRFDEAVEWLQPRVPHTTAELDELEDEARAWAFALVALLELAAVQAVFDEVANGLRQATPFADFKQRIKEGLLAKFGRGGHRVDTSVRTNAQTAYNAGRWYQLTNAAQTASKPYLMFDAVLDNRTTPTCSACDGIIKHADDPFWLSHHPPLHHNCRSSLRSLSTKEAEHRGVATDDPLVDVPEGFGFAPSIHDGVPRPDQARFDARVWEAYGTRERNGQEELAAAQAAANAKRLERDQRDPKWWLDNEYRGKYGEAGRAVAWGKAMEHRGLAMSPRKALAQHAKLVRAGAYDAGPRARAAIDAVLRSKGIAEDALSSAYRKGSLRELVLHAEDKGLHAEALHIRGMAALAGHRDSIGLMKRGAIKLKDLIPLPDALLTKVGLGKAAGRMTRFYEGLADASLKQPTGVTAYSDGVYRAKYRFLARDLYAGDGNLADMVHEWGHALEEANDTLAERALIFLDRRTSGETSVSMRFAMRSGKYGVREVTKPDKFYTPYMGRIYEDTPEVTEVTTMSIQAIVDQNPGTMLARDPDTLYFGLGQLAGDKLP